MIIKNYNKNMRDKTSNKQKKVNRPFFHIKN